MAPTKHGSTEPSSTAVAPSQRTIASFFGVGAKSGGSIKSKSSEHSRAEKKSATNKKSKLRIPSEASGQTQSQLSPSKRARVGNVPGKSAGDRGTDLNIVPLSPNAERVTNPEARKKSSDWLSTPSPSEPGKLVTKTFGRRDRKTMKSGVVAPVVTSSEDPERTNHRKAEKDILNPESVVGKRLKVFWPLDNIWYRGRVKSYDKALRSHVIRYDDGEEESVILNKERVKWVENVESPISSSKIKGTNGLHPAGKKSSPPSARKRKAVDVDDEEEADSLLEELKNCSDDDVRSKTPAKAKNAHSTILLEDSPVKHLDVSSDIYDEVDIDLPVEEPITKVRKRLRKKVCSSSPNTRKCDTEDVDFEEAKDDAEEGIALSGSSNLQLPRVSTSARRLLLEEKAVSREKLSSGENIIDLGATSPDETLSSKCEETASDSITINKKKLTTENISSTDKISESNLKKSQVNDFFSKLNKKSPKTGGDSRPSFLSPTIPTLKVDSSGSPKDMDGERLMKGELHSTLLGEHAERFGGRVEEKFKFLGKGRKDANGRRPNDPDFDSRTVLLPADFLKGLSGGQRQWWEFKSKHMDKVLFFKMGKFYELFEMDAHVGAQELDLQYMKGEQPHCGFPEKLYFECAEKLARKGYRVLIIEQTETPDQLEQRKRETGAKDKVVKREICAVLTKGTIVDGEMLTASPDAAYLMSITEITSCSSQICNTGKDAIIGVCFVDTSTSHIMVGQFDDDSARSRLRSVLSELRPVELIKPRGVLTEATERAISDHTRHPLVNSLIPGKEFWDAKTSLKQILEVFSSLSSTKYPKPSKDKSVTESTSSAEQQQKLPHVLQQVIAAGSRADAALSAIGGMLFYLREALLDQTLLRLGRIDFLQGSDSFSDDDVLCSQSGKEESKAGNLRSDYQTVGQVLEPHMILDSAALENLEILENNQDGGTFGTLLAHLDNCVTPYGKRLLRQWIVRPLIRVESILQRQMAIMDLKGVSAEAAMNFRKELKGQSDIERLLARLHASSGASGRNADNVVLYEDAAKKQLQEFMGALRGCRALLLAMKSFQSSSEKLVSSRLRNLVTPGLEVPDMTPVIEHFEASFDREEAEKTGRIVPHEGVDEGFDEADSAVKAASKELADYLVDQRKKFGNSSEIKYVTVGKEAYQMEIPEHFHAKVPSTYEVRSSRKGFRRYWTPEIKELLQDLTAGEQRREVALRGILQGLVKLFCEDYAKWLALIKCVAEVDVLISLSEASVNSSPTCTPTFVEGNVCAEKSPSTPRIVAKNIRHPIVCTNLAGCDAFVPNDITLGGLAPPFMLLTGPNMGGKSTLIRQICLAVVLAQIGANVTAEQLELSPVDRVFVRMGAKDHIMAGHSTFLVELSETASMLRSATSSSLVALDELGRGTSTSDGQAIAHSVLQHLAHNIGCRGMFSTHYHRLATHFSKDSRVGLHHMSCKVGTGVDGIEEVVFLYKLAAGACPKSYGVNVARLAGMPESVLRRASERASELESSWEKTTVCEKKGGSSDPLVLGLESNVDVHGSEADVKIATEALGLLAKIPVTGGSSDSFNSLLQVWLAAKQILQDNSVST